MIIITATTMDDAAPTSLSASAALSRMLQLASPMLPVGAYSYSQGFEAAIETGMVCDAASAQRWIADALRFYFARFELPMLFRMYTALRPGDDAAQWDVIFCAGRDTAESRAETLQTGYSLSELMRALEVGNFTGEEASAMSFPQTYARAAVAWDIPVSTCLHIYAWSWLENQVAVAMKAIPIGQVAGQKILLAIGTDLPAIVAAAVEVADDDLSNFAPGLSLAACYHETQYSRLFRS